MYFWSQDLIRAGPPPRAGSGGPGQICLQHFVVFAELLDPETFRQRMPGCLSGITLADNCFFNSFVSVLSMLFVEMHDCTMDQAQCGVASDHAGCEMLRRFSEAASVCVCSDPGMTQPLDPSPNRRPVHTFTRVTTDD